MSEQNQRTYRITSFQNVPFEGNCILVNDQLRTSTGNQLVFPAAGGTVLTDATYYNQQSLLGLDRLVSYLEHWINVGNITMADIRQYVNENPNNLQFTCTSVNDNTYYRTITLHIDKSDVEYAYNRIEVIATNDGTDTAVSEATGTENGDGTITIGFPIRADTTYAVHLIYKDSANADVDITVDATVDAVTTWNKPATP